MTSDQFIDTPHIYGKHVGSLRFYENRIYVALNEYAPITDSVEIKDIDDLKKVITINLLKEKANESQ